MKTRLSSMIMVWVIGIVPVGAQTITAVSTFNNIGVDVTFGSPPADGTAITMTIKKSGDSGDYREIHPLCRIAGTKFAGSAFDLDPGTAYAIQLSSSAFSSNQFLAVSTRAEAFPSATNTVYHVAVTGNDGNSGLSASNAFRTLGHALGVVQPGDTILLYTGRYYEGDIEIFNYQSGTATDPIVIQNAPGASPVLDGTDTNFSPTWVVYDATHHLYRTPSTRIPWFAYLNGEHMLDHLNLEDLRTNRWEQTAGYHADGAYIYVRFPGGAAPGTNVVTIPMYSWALELGANNYQIRGLEFCYYGYGALPRAIYLYISTSNLIEHCTFHHNTIGVSVKYAANHNVIQYCSFNESPVDKWSWNAVKQCGVEYEAGGVFVYGSDQPNQGNVIRYNLFENAFDGARIYSEDPLGPSVSMDFHDNIIRNCGDDGMETDGNGSNVRIYNNRIYNFLTGISIAPAATGPTYIFRNLLVGWHNQDGYEGYPFKLNSQYNQLVNWVYLYHNTCFTDVSGQRGFLFKEYTDWTNIVSRNNIYAGTHYALESWSEFNPVDFDYDDLYTTNKSIFIRWMNTEYSSVSAFFQATGQEAHGLSMPPGFENVAASNFQLAGYSGLIDRGVLIPGVNDTFVGLAPDIGAYEFTGLVATGVVAAADFDGDQLADPALVMTNGGQGNWYVWLSSLDYACLGPYAFGAAAATPVPGDYDGDGKADPAVYASDNWYVWLSASGYLGVGPVPFNVANATAGAADFDGDGKADPALFADGRWYAMLSSCGYVRLGPFAMGATGAVPVPADYDGDGKADPATCDGTGWTVWPSAAGYGQAGPFPFGMAGMTAVAADFDGDRLADPAVYGSGNWYVWFSSAGYAQLGPFPLSAP
ncbi:MAG: right-handed parallel beta-helix repeat-containing protein [Kiritimatiellae bacterium]|nr:right-handed parallel beta-helix repeat-containing protein [Verrucomicrobiota bacterium]MCG2661084.1 right-handed parallel beta-helix repeat-containing protein [Kiritimatiellia bacterium]